MNKWLIYVLGIITGIVLTFSFAYCVNQHRKSGLNGLELLENPEENMGYSMLKVFQVIDSGYALALADGHYDSTVLLIPNEKQQFYDDQEIVLKNNQCAQRVGTYKYTNDLAREKTVPAVKIIDGVDGSNPAKSVTTKNVSGKTIFDKPGDCVSRKNFEVQKVLDSGDAIALEVIDNSSGYVFTSDLEVLLLAHDGSDFYNNQIVRAPRGKCARQIGTYKYSYAGTTKVIPIIDFR